MPHTSDAFAYVVGERKSTDPDIGVMSQEQLQALREEVKKYRSDTAGKERPIQK